MRIPDLDRILAAMLQTYDGISDLNFSVGHPMQVEDFGELKPVLFCTLRNSKARAVKDTRKSKLDASICRIGRIIKIIDAESKCIHRRRGQEICPGRHKGVKAVLKLLTISGRPDGPIKFARIGRVHVFE